MPTSSSPKPVKPDLRITLLGGLAACGPWGFSELFREARIQSLEIDGLAPLAQAGRVATELALLACDGLIERYDDTDAFDLTDAGHIAHKSLWDAYCAATTP